MSFQISKLKVRSKLRGIEPGAIKGGVRNDGTLTALEMTSLVNTGAYANHGYTVTFMSGFVALGMYQCPHKRFQARVAYTNTMPSGAFRGYGATQGTFAVDCFLDETARRLGLDPLELKLRNIIKTGGPPRFCELPEAGDARGSYGLDECVDRVKNTLGSPLERDLLHDTGKRIGRGFGITMMGGGPNEEQKPPPAVTMSRERNGGFTLRTGAVDVGTGSDTTLRQIAAETLGVDPESIALVSADTATTPYDPGSYASATVFITGETVRKAASELKRRIESGDDFPTVTCENRLDRSSLGFAVQGIEVEVDEVTGKVVVTKAVQAVDLGKAVNPSICRGQVEGGHGDGRRLYTV